MRSNRTISAALGVVAAAGMAHAQDLPYPIDFVLNGSPGSDAVLVEDIFGTADAVDPYDATLGFNPLNPTSVMTLTGDTAQGTPVTADTGAFFNPAAIDREPISTDLDNFVAYGNGTGLVIGFPPDFIYCLPEYVYAFSFDQGATPGDVQFRASDNIPLDDNATIDYYIFTPETDPAIAWFGPFDFNAGTCTGIIPDTFRNVVRGSGTFGPTPNGDYILSLDTLDSNGVEVAGPFDVTFLFEEISLVLEGTNTVTDPPAPIAPPVFAAGGSTQITDTTLVDRGAGIDRKAIVSAYLDEDSNFIAFSDGAEYVYEFQLSTAATIEIENLEVSSDQAANANGHVYALTNDTTLRPDVPSFGGQEIGNTSLVNTLAFTGARQNVLGTFPANDPGQSYFLIIDTTTSDGPFNIRLNFIAPAAAPMAADFDLGTLPATASVTSISGSTRQASGAFLPTGSRFEAYSGVRFEFLGDATDQVTGAPDLIYRFETTGDSLIVVENQETPNVPDTAESQDPAFHTQQLLGSLDRADSFPLFGEVGPTSAVAFDGLDDIDNQYGDAFEQGLDGFLKPVWPAGEYFLVVDESIRQSAFADASATPPIADSAPFDLELQVTPVSNLVDLVDSFQIPIGTQLTIDASGSTGDNTGGVGPDDTPTSWDGSLALFDAGGNLLGTNDNTATSVQPVLELVEELDAGVYWLVTAGASLSQAIAGNAQYGAVNADPTAAGAGTVPDWNIEPGADSFQATALNLDFLDASGMAPVSLGTLSTTVGTGQVTVVRVLVDDGAPGETDPFALPYNIQQTALGADNDADPFTPDTAIGNSNDRLDFTSLTAVSGLLDTEALIRNADTGGLQGNGDGVAFVYQQSCFGINGGLGPFTILTNDGSYIPSGNYFLVVGGDRGADAFDGIGPDFTDLARSSISGAYDLIYGVDAIAPGVPGFGAPPINFNPSAVTLASQFVAADTVNYHAFTVDRAPDTNMLPDATQVDLALGMIGNAGDTITLSTFNLDPMNPVGTDDATRLSLWDAEGNLLVTAQENRGIQSEFGVILGAGSYAFAVTDGFDSTVNDEFIFVQSIGLDEDCRSFESFAEDAQQSFFTASTTPAAGGATTVLPNADRVPFIMDNFENLGIAPDGFAGVAIGTFSIDANAAPTADQTAMAPFPTGTAITISTTNQNGTVPFDEQVDTQLGLFANTNDLATMEVDLNGLLIAFNDDADDGIHSRIENPDLEAFDDADNMIDFDPDVLPDGEYLLAVSAQEVGLVDGWGVNTDIDGLVDPNVGSTVVTIASASSRSTETFNVDLTTPGQVVWIGFTVGDGNPVPEPEGCNPADIAPPFGQLDLSDVQTFLIGFGGMDPVADIAGGNPGPDGMFDLQDVQTFLIAFGAGCPE